jgi:hypothetical protein
MLLGATADSMRVWDIVRMIEALRAAANESGPLGERIGPLPLRVEAAGDMAVNALYASLFTPIEELVLTDVPSSHMKGPDYLNVLRILDLPQAVAMASERTRVELRGIQEADWSFAAQAARKFGWEQNLRLAGESAAR